MSAFEAAEGVISGPLDEYRVAIEAWTESLLRPYLEWLGQNHGHRRATKEFNDPVWGTIVLQAHEVVVLDSPLIQRLRRIRQLGVVQLVYPGANHTRFEHSLGVCHQVSQIARALNIHSDGHTTISDEWIDVLRLAGLMHDVGHGLMSHVVENALASDDDCEDLLIAFKKYVKRSKNPQLSEMAAFFMIRSPAVVELLTAAYGAINRGTPTDITHAISRIIVGKNVDNELPILHELISGPFDADKLDYMPRDAVMCGVPVVTDVVRLVQKVRAVRVPSSGLPVEMKRYINEDARGHVVFGVARSGASALDEVSLSRSLMFDKIYRHHKVRAVESMVAAVIQLTRPIFSEHAALMPLTVMDDEFVELTADDLNRMNANSGSPVSPVDITVASEILTRIRNRHLFARSFAFAQTMPFDAYRDETEQESGNERFVREISDDPAKRDEYVARIVTEAIEIASLVGRTSQLDAIGIDALSHYIRIDPPASGGHGSESDQSRAYLIDEGGDLLKVEKVRAESRGWADAYVNAKDVGFVFAPSEISDIVHIAAEVATRMMYGVRIPRQMHNYAKKGGSDLGVLRASLATAGYFSAKPQDLAPQPAHFDLMMAKDQISEALTHLRGYMGPTHRTDAMGGSGSMMNETKIVHWASQFTDSSIPLALSVVHSIKMLSREDANDTLQKFVLDHPEFKQSSLVPLGEPKDGSAVHAYFANDAAQELKWELRAVREALLHEEPIVFIDDIVGLGRSAVNIFRVLMGVDNPDDLGEVREVELTEVEKEAIRNREVAIVWAAGYPDGAAHVADELKKLGINATTFVNLLADSLPTVFTAIEAYTEDEQNLFLDELRVASRDLQPDASSATVEERLLGYGNLGLLVVNSYNTPTATLGPLWMSGTVAGKPWQALTPRRKKL